MTHVNHQTIRLSRGKHSSPEAGACVMELASMLAGESFSDHPVSVCPVIGAFLRAYNDAIDDDRRQDLYAYAAKVVGSQASTEVQRQRAERVSEWLWDVKARNRLLPTRRRRHRKLTKPSTSQVAALAARTLCKRWRAVHAEALALIDELLEMGKPPRTGSEIERVLGLRQARQTPAEVH
jgi:hypothetical protein